VNLGSGKAMGTRTQWARGVGIASGILIWFYPIASPIVGAAAVFLVRLDLDDITAGRAPQLDASRTKRFFWLLLGALVLESVVAFLNPHGRLFHHS